MISASRPRRVAHPTRTFKRRLCLAYGLPTSHVLAAGAVLAAGFFVARALDTPARRILVPVPSRSRVSHR